MTLEYIQKNRSELLKELNNSKTANQIRKIADIKSLVFQYDCVRGLELIVKLVGKPTEERFKCLLTLINTSFDIKTKERSHGRILFYIGW